MFFFDVDVCQNNIDFLFFHHFVLISRFQLLVNFTFLAVVWAMVKANEL